MGQGEVSEAKQFNEQGRSMQTSKPKRYNTPDGPKFGKLVPMIKGSKPKGDDAVLAPAAFAMLLRPQGVTLEELRRKNKSLGGSDSEDAAHLHMCDAVGQGHKVMKTVYESPSYHIVID